MTHLEEKENYFFLIKTQYITTIPDPFSNPISLSLNLKMLNLQKLINKQQLIPIVTLSFKTKQIISIKKKRFSN